MQFESVKHIAQYYKAIPGMLRLLQQEREELEGNYYGLRGLAYDGTPHSSSPGKPTEEAGLRALESGVGDRLAEIKANETVLSADAAAIRGCVDAVNGKYKQVILMRYVRGYSWAKTGVRMNAPDSTVRNWHERAMERFGEALEELPEPAEQIRRFLEGKLRGRTPDEKEKKRLCDALLRRGFSWSDVGPALRELGAETEE